MDAVSRILVARAPVPRGLETTLLWSLAAHAVLVVLAVVAGPAWLGSEPVLREVMTISLGGAPGPDAAEGVTPISARPIQRAAELPPAPAPVRPPAAAVPEVTVPAPEARQPDRAPIEEASSLSPERTGSRTVTTGPEEREGTAVADTGVVRGQGFGLASGGGQQGTGVTLDVGNFCCPEYIRTMQQVIQNNWNERQGAVGEVRVKFTILRSGAITRVELEGPSGHPRLDQEAQRALLLTQRLPRLPDAFPDAELTVHLIFQYRRS